MKKVSSTISHVSVIGLALLALLVATVVWLFERTRAEDSGRTPGATSEIEAISFVEDEGTENAPNLAPDTSAEGRATTL